MNRFFNPFRYIAGAKALILGLVFIAASALMLYSGNLIQDSYIHIGMADASLWLVLAMQMAWLLPAVMNNTLELVAALQSGAMPDMATYTPLMIYGVWSIAGLVLFYIWNYNAFATSCNVSGWKAIVAFIAVQVVMTIVGTLI